MQFFYLGKVIEQKFTEKLIIYLVIGGPLLMFNQWFLVIWVNDCATGVVFTRNPSDGAKEIYGEYLINAQGEDVVAGTRTPQNITKKENSMSKEFNGRCNAKGFQKLKKY